MKTPTVREIAKACGVSAATVSRALSNSPLLSEETRLRVQEKAQGLGWVPNPLSSIYMAHLRSTRPLSYRATLAYVVPYPDPELYVEYHKRHCLGAMNRAASLGYQLDVLWLKDFGYSMRKLTSFLKARGIPGVVLNGGELEANVFADFDWDSFAIASWGFSLESPHLHQAGFYYVQGMRLLMDKLLAMNYTRIAMVMSEDSNRFSGYALLPFFNRLELHPPHKGLWLKSYHHQSWHSNRTERRKLQAWLQKYRPEVVIGETLAWEAIVEMGWQIPGDIAFASPNWSELWSHVAGVDHLPEVIGANSVELVADQLNRNDRGIPQHPKLIVSEGVWRDAPSVPVCAGR